MSKVLKYSMLVSLIGWTTPAAAADWYYIGFTGSGESQAVFFVDNEIFGGSSFGPKKAWVYRISKKLSSDGIRKSKFLASFNCTDRTYTLISYLHLGNNDVTIRSGDISTYNQEPTYVVPDSIGYTEWSFVCGNKSDGIELDSTSPDEFAANFFRIGKN